MKDRVNEGNYSWMDSLDHHAISGDRWYAM
jgi:hypothetical protein